MKFSWCSYKFIFIKILDMSENPAIKGAIEDINKIVKEDHVEDSYGFSE